VNPRWFLGLTVFGFVLFIAAVTMYMSSGETPRPRADERKAILAELASDEAGEGGVSLREHFTKLRAARESATAERERLAERARPHRPRVSNHWREQIGQLADRIDDTAVRLRSDISGSPVVRLAAGAAEIQSGRADAAVQEFDRVLAKRPADVTALSGKASALVTMERFEEAAGVYAELVRTAPGDTVARYNYGVLLYRLARFGEAAEQFRRLVEIDPKHARGQYNLATLAQRAGRLDEAREAWEVFTRLEPRAANGWFNLGVVWMDFNRPIDAVRCFLEAAAINPEDSDAWLNLGLAYGAAGHLEAALEAITKADAVAPCDPTIMRCLADLHSVLADQGGPGAETHRHLAAALEEKLRPPDEQQTEQGPVAATAAEGD